jgi:hypothetical protein
VFSSGRQRWRADQRTDDMRNRYSLVLALTCAAAPLRLVAQENYEIQVYPSETADKGKTLFELHSNFTGMGRKLTVGALLPTNGALHETLEITHGFTDIFEVGFYVFTSASAGEGWQFVGSHIRPRIRAPESWKLPVGLSVSTEFGPTSKKFDESEFGIELRPIIDQTVGKLYWSFNPNIEWSMKGPEAGKGIHGMIFNPSVKLGWQFTEKVQAGVEYYGTTGPLTELAPSNEQSHMLYPSVDLFLSPDWEFNAGVGFLVSGTGDRNIVKVILGRRVPW